MGETNSSSESDRFEIEDGDREICTEDMDNNEIPPLDMEEDDQVEAEDFALGKVSEVPPIISYEVKLRELLRNLCSIELKIYSEASKEFVNMLRCASGRELLHQYVQASPLCVELMEAWKLRQGKAGMVHVFSLIAVILDHPDGKYSMNDPGRLTISRRLDKLSHLIVETKIQDVYAELNSKETRRQSAALFLLAAIVRRGVGLASEVAKIFNFKLPVFPKLAEVQQRKEGKKTKYSTRPSFIEYAMSFLEVGDPRLLRWVLQQKDMYFGVLRGLGSDDDATVVYVLSTLRNKVLSPDSLVPPSLRSVLFGGVTLEQLSNISGNPLRGHASKMAHEILVMVCTDPCNGLMPDLKSHMNPLRGNPKRLLELMKKLKATEVGHHRDLLLALVSRRPSLGSAYMDEFPYVLEPRASPLWFDAISLAADLISSANTEFSFASLASHSCDPPTLGSPEMQCILKCIVPRALTRLVINRGLLHSDILVKHGSLRLLLEAIRSFDRLIGAINDVLKKLSEKRHKVVCSEGQLEFNNLQGIGVLGKFGKCLNTDKVGVSYIQKWVSLKQEFQDEVRAILPDPQVLLTCSQHKNLKNLKRERASESLSEIDQRDVVKKLKSDSVDDGVDILIGGVNELSTSIHGSFEKGKGTFIMEEVDPDKDRMMVLSRIWGSHEFCGIVNDLKDADIYLHSKLLDVLTFYLRTMPFALEGSFDFFKMLPSNPLTLTVSQQKSLLSLLMEYVGQSHVGNFSVKGSQPMYKYLEQLILLMHSQVKSIQDQAYALAREAMLSTGAFDRNPSEIDVWFVLLPGTNQPTMESHMAEVFCCLSTSVISFFCDAVSTMGNKLYHWLDNMRTLTSKLQNIEDNFLDFSPLVGCILDKCLRLLDSNSRTFKLSEKSLISIYVSNALRFLLQTQVDARALAGLIELILTERFGGANVENDHSGDSLCEWRPLKNLLHFVQKILHQQACYALRSITARMGNGGHHSLQKILHEVKKMIAHGVGRGSVELAVSFLSALTCASPDDRLENFPFIINVARHMFGGSLSFLSWIFFLECNFLADVANLWPDMFNSGMEMVGATISSDRQDDACLGGCDMGNLFITEQSTSCEDMDSMESIAIAFSLFLKNASFYVLFPSIMTFESSEFLGSTKIRDLFKAKLSECSTDDLILSLRLLLFWVHQIRTSLRANPSCELEQLLQICFFLIEHILSHLFVMTSDFDNSNTSGPAGMPICVKKIAEVLFCHPIVTESISCPLHHVKKLVVSNIGDSLEDFLCSSKQSVHLLDHHVVHLLNSFADYLVDLGNSQSSLEIVNDTVYRSVVNAFRQVVQWAMSLFKDEFDLYVLSNDLIPLLPRFYVLDSLMRFISPFELLGLVNWMLDKVENMLIGCKSSRSCALTVGFYIAGGAFDILSSYLRKKNTETRIYHLFWGMESGAFDATLLERVYFKVIDLATCVRLECADLCLLKAVDAVYSQKSVPPQTALLPLNMALLRMIARSPKKMLTHLITRTSKTRAKALSQLTELSPMHLSLFGQVFLCVLNSDSSSLGIQKTPSSISLKGKAFVNKCNYAFSDEEFILLLPAALSYLISNSKGFRKHYVEPFRIIPLLYSRIILDGFSNWKNYVSRNIFHEEYKEFAPSSMDGFLGLFSRSLLGKAMHMLQFSTLNGNPICGDRRLKIFDAMYASSGSNDELLDCNVNDINIHSSKEILNFVNRTVAKITFSVMILFPQVNSIYCRRMETDESTKELMLLKEESNEINSARLRFVNIMVGSLDKIIRRSLLISENCNVSDSADCCLLFRFLEVFMLEYIVQICKEIQGYLNQLHSIPFLEPFIRSSLLHRFDDPMRLKALRNILSLLPKGKFSGHEVLELMLSHSQFVSTILWSDSISDSSCLSLSAKLFRPISSLLKFLVLPAIDPSLADKKSIFEASSELRYRQYDVREKKLELIKLLRVLFHINSCQGNVGSSKDLGVNSRDLFSLLLSGYGATLSEIDVQIFHLLHEIESFIGSDCGSIAEMDYLWGSSALKIRREQKLETFLLSNNVVDYETAEERRKRHFRENLPVDPKLCAMTVLHFLGDTTARTGDFSLELHQVPCCSVEKIQQYDLAFILPFSIHSLLMDYIEPVEFAGLGLLAVAFVSLSSPDEGIRKLGYEALGRLKNALENHRNNKDGLRLRLLLTYMQNGISEPWQEIPSLIAIFAAEASFILLDPSNNHYLTISKFLMHSPRVDLKCVPLFHTFFGSSSVHFKADRLWILCLSYAGLNSNDDAQIFRRKYLLELLLSFYASSLSDSDSRILILQIVKKSVRLPKSAYHLVEHCGLVSWLSSIISFSGQKLGDQKEFYLTQMVLVVEAVNDVISSRNFTEWLQTGALEQLSELSSCLYIIFVNGFKLFKENAGLVNSVLSILVSTLRISQKRKIYQPHFTLSVEGLFQLFQAIDDGFDEIKIGRTAELGLNLILMSTPSTVIFSLDGAKMLNLVMWVVTVALQASTTQSFLFKESNMEINLEEQQCEDTIISKLLRWLIASVILSKFSNKSSVPPLDRSSIYSLQSLLEHMKIIQCEGIINDCSIREVLAAIILHLQQFLGMNCTMLRSVVSALCFLLFDAISSAGLGDSNTTALCSKIRCPVEADPAWRWSYYRPWEDRSSLFTDTQKMEEQHACQTLLMIFSDSVQRSSLDLPVLSCQDVENSGLFAWERNLILTTEQSMDKPESA